jgi:Extensin-like protein C-terminus
MSRSVRLYFVGSFVLLALAGCGGGWFMEQREPWRHEAEVACLKSGAVKESAAVTQLPAINGPGACGADFPLKVASLGETAVLGFADEMRPPGTIPQYSPVARAPVAPRYEPYPAQSYEPQYRPQAQEPAYRQPRHEPPYQPTMPPYGGRPVDAGAPLSLKPPGVGPEEDDEDEAYPAPSQPRYRPGSVSRPTPRPEPYTRPYSRGDGPYVPPQTQPSEPYFTPAPRTYGGRGYPAEPVQPDPLPPLGPSRGPAAAGGPAAIAPAATLACPMVSTLDQWIAGSVQPAAQRWFGQPVAEIRQISAYSCRGMNGNRHARISEHAFGNALDISAFTLADGRKVTVREGWRGLPEERGFLRDVHAAACEQFTTVLGPGSNIYHADHLHLDLMRRSSGQRICNPAAVPGDLVAGRRGETVTGSLGKARPRVLGFAGESESAARARRSLPAAVPGED